MAAPSAYDVWLANVSFRSSTDARPVVIIDCLPLDRYVVLCISSQMGMYDGSPTQFRIERRDPDYDKTGLTRDECYIEGSELHYIEKSELVKQYGVIIGELRKRFDKWL